MKRLLLFAFLICSSILFAQAKRPFTFEDMMALKRVNEPVPSPDGRWVLFSVVDVSLQENSRKPHIWIAPLRSDRGGVSAERAPDRASAARGRNSEPAASVVDPSKEARQLTFDPAGEDRPRWAPDGRHFAFISAKGGSSQVWMAEFNPETAELGPTQQVTNISTEADGELWSADGKNIVFVSTVWPECSAGVPGTERPAQRETQPNPQQQPSQAQASATDPAQEDACNKQRDTERAASKVKAQIFTRLFFRHWTTYSVGKRSHLFVVPADAASPQPGRDLTPGDHDVPPFSLGGQDL